MEVSRGIGRLNGGHRVLTGRDRRGSAAVEDLFGQKPAPVAQPVRPAARKPPARPPALARLERIFERYHSERPEGPGPEGGEGHFGIGLWLVRQNVILTWIMV
jgi:hypothetical protein